MEFLVKLINVYDTKNATARRSLYDNCTHVANCFWLFEGDEIALDSGINFSIVDEQIIEATGGMSGKQIVSMVKETYAIDECFLQ